MSSPSNPNDRRPARRIPLRVVLIVPFVLQIFAAVGLTGYFSLRNGQRAVNDLVTQLMDEVDDRIIEKISTFLETPVKLNQINATALKLGQIDIRNIPELERHFWHQTQIFQDISFFRNGQ